MVLTGKSLLAQGMISRLRQYSRLFSLRVLNVSSPDFLQQVSEFRPEIIIFDERDIKASSNLTLADFLDFMPEVILVELQLETSDVKMIQGARVKASNAEELFQIINSFGGVS
jgi:hypothetical protein